jgi:hypothetical protein
MTHAAKVAAGLTPREIETLIADLAVLRARLLPAVPLDPPSKQSPDSDDRGQISEQSEPHFAVRRLRDVFNFTVRQACWLRDYLTASLPATPGDPNLLDEEVGGPHGPH